MAFTKGNKLGGRTSGSKNKVSQEIRNTFLQLLEDNLPKFQKDLDGLEAKDRIKLLLEIASFCTPKLKATDLTIEKDNNPSIVIDMSKWK